MGFDVGALGFPMGWGSMVTISLWVSILVVWVFQWVGFRWFWFCCGFRFRWFRFSSGLGFGGFGFAVGGGLGFGFSVDEMVEGGGVVSGGGRKIHG